MVHDVDGWRNGSASDSSPEGYGFDSRAVHLFFLSFFSIFFFVAGSTVATPRKASAAAAHSHMVKL